jgi:hypothetical protein
MQRTKPILKQMMMREQTQIQVARIVKSVMHAKNKTHLKANDDARTNKLESHACKGNQAATHDTSSDLFTAGVHELRPT